jgi:hypothetical protein
LTAFLLINIDSQHSGILLERGSVRINLGEIDRGRRIIIDLKIIIRGKNYYES